MTDSPAARHLVTVGIQVLPLTEDAYPIVDQAIAAIVATGLPHQITPLETVIEGTLDECLAAVRAAHNAVMSNGVRYAVTIVKISDGTEGSTIDDKLEKYR